MIQLDRESGDVTVRDATGATLWSGRPLGHRAVAALPIDGTDDAVVLCDPDAVRGRPFRNLVRLSARGAVTWQAELPAGQGDDAYVAVAWSGSQLMANTWSCYRVQIDPKTGRIVSQTFTK